MMLPDEVPGGVFEYMMVAISPGAMFLFAAFHLCKLVGPNGCQCRCL